MIEIGLLGSLRVRRDGADLTPSAPKLRRVLALLVLNANSLVSVDQLCEELWEDRPPLSALTTLQTYIYQLRRRLGLAGDQTGVVRLDQSAAQPLLVTRVGGYELRLDGRESVDVHSFDVLVTRGRAELESGDFGRAADTLRGALGIWRGQALVDIGVGQRLSAWCTQLEQRRKGAMEQLFAAELELGHHHVVLDELAGAVRMHPSHEGFAAQLMLALHRCGRRSEALDVFRSIRAHLIAELGLEPTGPLRQLHQAVLADDPKLLAMPKQTNRIAAEDSMAPAQLPPDIPGFVGRDRELARLAAYLGADNSAEPSLRVVEMHGAPGVGKTALATRAAHRLRPHFPDGQLFVDLSGVGTGATQMSNVLVACLRSCGLRRDELPTGLDELSRMFRSWTANRRVLMVVDDVLTASQLRPLMPGGAGCAVIATYRYRAQGLSVGKEITLRALTEEQALELFGRIAGEWRFEDEPDAVRQLVRMCDLLPLAVRAVAARLASRPGWSVARLVKRIAGDEMMLLELPAGAQSLLGTVESNYRMLPEEYSEVLRAIVAGDRRRWHLEDVASLVGNRFDVETVVDYLVDVHLVEELHTGEDRPAYTVSRLTRCALRYLLGAADEVPAARGHSLAAAAHRTPQMTRRPQYQI